MWGCLGSAAETVKSVVHTPGWFLLGIYNCTWLLSSPHFSAREDHLGGTIRCPLVLPRSHPQSYWLVRSEINGSLNLYVRLWIAVTGKHAWKPWYGVGQILLKAGSLRVGQFWQRIVHPFCRSNEHHSCSADRQGAVCCRQGYGVGHHKGGILLSQSCQQQYFVHNEEIRSFWM